MQNKQPIFQQIRHHTNNILHLLIDGKQSQAYNCIDIQQSQQQLYFKQIYEDHPPNNNNMNNMNNKNNMNNMNNMKMLKSTNIKNILNTSKHHKILYTRKHQNDNRYCKQIQQYDKMTKILLQLIQLVKQECREQQMMEIFVWLIQQLTSTISNIQFTNISKVQQNRRIQKLIKTNNIIIQLTNTNIELPLKTITQLLLYYTRIYSVCKIDYRQQAYRIYKQIGDNIYNTINMYNTIKKYNVYQWIQFLISQFQDDIYPSLFVSNTICNNNEHLLMTIYCRLLFIMQNNNTNSNNNNTNSNNNSNNNFKYIYEYLNKYILHNYQTIQILQICRQYINKQQQYIQQLHQQILQKCTQQSNNLLTLMTKSHNIQIELTQRVQIMHSLLMLESNQLATIKQYQVMIRNIIKIYLINNINMNYMTKIGYGEYWIDIGILMCQIVIQQLDKQLQKQCNIQQYSVLRIDRLCQMIIHLKKYLKYKTDLLLKLQSIIQKTLKNNNNINDYIYLLLYNLQYSTYNQLKQLHHNPQLYYYRSSILLIKLNNIIKSDIINNNRIINTCLQILFVSFQQSLSNLIQTSNLMQQNKLSQQQQIIIQQLIIYLCQYNIITMCQYLINNHNTIILTNKLHKQIIIKHIIKEIMKHKHDRIQYYTTYIDLLLKTVLLLVTQIQQWLHQNGCIINQIMGVILQLINCIDSDNNYYEGIQLMLLVIVMKCVDSRQQLLKYWQRNKMQVSMWNICTEYIKELSMVIDRQMDDKQQQNKIENRQQQQQDIIIMKYYLQESETIQIQDKRSVLKNWYQAKIKNINKQKYCLGKRQGLYEKIQQTNKPSVYTHIINKHFKQITQYPLLHQVSYYLHSHNITTVLPISSHNGQIRRIFRPIKYI